MRVAEVWGNHGTFKLYLVDREQRPDLVQRFEIDTLPTLVVVEKRIVRARLEPLAVAARSRAFSRPGSSN